MNQEDVDAVRLTNNIHQAFSDVQYPGDDEIAAADGLEENEIADSLRGRHWRELDSKFLNGHCIASIPFLDFKAYRFFLPAFLLAAVSDFRKVPEIVQDLMSSLLDPLTYQKLYYPSLYKEGEAVDWYTFVCRMKPLTHAQAEVIVDFLRFLCKYHAEDFPHHEPQFALEGYWRNRLNLEKEK